MSIKKYYSAIGRILRNLQNLPVEYKINKEMQKALLEIVPTGTSMTDKIEHIGYLAICKLAVEYDDIFKIFKRSKDYIKVLEHVSQGQGKAYLDIIKKMDRGLLGYFSKFKENDKIGSPRTYNYYEVGRFSPTTLRYIKVLMDLKNFFGSLNKLNIVEIGAGYGGQCKIILDIFTPQSYTIIDLGFVLPLIAKYLTKLNIENIVFLTLQQIGDNKEYDLVISNYAFSECTKSVQNDYLNKILFRSRRGYLICNYNGASSSTMPYNKKELCEILSKKHTITIINEEPKTGPDNFIIKWDDTGR